MSRTSPVVLLGPQRFRPTVTDALGILGRRGTVALVSAGWQERESEDEELRTHVGAEVVNLEIYRRCEQIFERDRELFVGLRRRQDRLRELQQLYRVRLHGYLSTLRELLGRAGPDGLGQRESDDAFRVVRDLDAHHLSRVREIHDEFNDRFRAGERAEVARHRRELSEILAGVEALAIAGGHVMVLLNRMRLVDVLGMVEALPVVAWSAGAMAIADMVVAFHDSPPQGPGHAEVLDGGFGLYHGLLPLPHARRRLRLDDTLRVSILARRFAPAACVTLDDGARVHRGAAGYEYTHEVAILRPDGAVEAAV